MSIESIFDQFWWLSYVTLELMSMCVNLIISINFFMNLLHSLDVWLFGIWHLFDNLTPRLKPPLPITGLFFDVGLEKWLSWSQFLTDFHIWGTKSKLRTCSTRCIHFHCVYLSAKGQNRHRKCRGRQKFKKLIILNTFCKSVDCVLHCRLVISWVEFVLKAWTC